MPKRKDCGPGRSEVPVEGNQPLRGLERSGIRALLPKLQPRDFKFLNLFESPDFPDNVRPTSANG